MIAFVLANWKSIVVGIAVAALALLLHTVDVYRIEANQRAALAAQKTTDVAQCNADKQVTKEANDALQNDRDNLTKRLAADKLQRPAACVSVARSADVHDRSGRPARPNGVSSDWLYDFSADQCSSYWRQLKTCNQFIINERKLKQ